MIVLVTGGSASGKSAFAEKLASSFAPPRYYLATMRPFGESGRARVERHRELRAGKGFITIERYEDLRGLASAESAESVGIGAGGAIDVASSEGLSDSVKTLGGGTILLEDLGNLVTNEMFAQRADGSWALHNPVPAVMEGIEALADRCGDLVVVGNEVGADFGADYDETTRAFVRALGEVSCRVAAMAEVVVECSAGIPHVVKGEPSAWRF